MNDAEPRTLLFTDIEGSTRLLDRVGQETYAGLLMEHHRLLRGAFATHAGREVDTQGDAFFFAFGTAGDAVAAAAMAQRALATHPWPPGGEIRVRIGIHSGAPLAVEEAYVGLDVHRAARICGAAHGGQVVMSDSAHRAAVGGLPPGVTSVSLGTHTLKDLSLPQQLWQLVVPGLPDAFPQLQTLTNRATNLPPQRSSFVGRTREIARVADSITSGGARLVTLVGPGGSGKTRLALHVGAGLVDAFSEGVFLVELASVRETEFVIPAVAQALGLRERPGESLDAVVTGYLRERRLLLVMDNFEHVLGAGEGVSGLLTECAELHVLATSRAPMRLEGELTFEVGPLSLDASSARASDAVALLLERSPRPVAAGDLSVMAAICAQVDALPLAIELVAARLTVLAPTELLIRLERRLPLLTGGRRDLPERQRTLRATIAWSYGLLRSSEKALLDRLSVFVGGWTLDDAEAVCQASLEDLEMLIESSLVHRKLDRMAMLETIREFAADRMTRRGEGGGLAQRHSEHFARRESTLAATPEWCASIDADYGNMQVALVWALKADDAELAARIAGALGRYWELRGLWGEGRAHLGHVLEIADAVLPAVRTPVLLQAGRLAILQRDRDAAAPLLEAAARACRELGDARGLVLALSNLGGLARNEQALVVARQHGDTWTVALALNNLAMALLEQGDAERAAPLAQESAVLRRELGDDFGLAFTLDTVADIAQAQGDLQHAAETLDALESLARRTGHVILADALVKRALLTAEQSPPNWRERLAEGIELAAAAGDPELLVIALHALAAGSTVPQDRQRFLGAARSLMRTYALSEPLHGVGLRMTTASESTPVGWDASLADSARLTLDGAAELARKGAAAPTHVTAPTIPSG